MTVPRSAAVAAVQKLYERRIAGLERGDVAAWLQGLRGATLIKQQRAVFDRMRALEVADLMVAGVTQLPGNGTAAATERQQLQVGFSYRLTGLDTAPRRFVLDLMVEDAPGTAAGLVVTASRPADRPQPWDLPDLQVRRSAAMLVALSGTAAEAD
ncbi:hypothetical protein, partial [Intrasporangium chromatireducens]|uniref:hypothetical protein n=1 Tax=Intrasporangium chromatireducens TaxID=1386088 RepID=UPI001969EDCC